MREKEQAAKDAATEKLEERPLIWWLTRLSVPALCGLAAFLITLIVGSFGLGMKAAGFLATSEPSKENVPQANVEPPDWLRLVVDSITLGTEQRGQAPYASASMSVGNIGPGSLLIRSVSVIFGAIDRSNGSRLNYGTTILENVRLEQGSIEPIGLNSPALRPWEIMGNATQRLPAFETHFFEFTVQVQATVASTGQEVWLDLTIPAPGQMTCNHPCVAVHGLNIATGKASHEKCDAYQSASGWTTDCFVREKL
jgi:hypothetical protein